MDKWHENEEFFSDYGEFQNLYLYCVDESILG